MAVVQLIPSWRLCNDRNKSHPTDFFWAQLFQSRLLDSHFDLREKTMIIMIVNSLGIVLIERLWAYVVEKDMR